MLSCSPPPCLLSVGDPTGVCEGLHGGYMACSPAWCGQWSYTRSSHVDHSIQEYPCCTLGPLEMTEVFTAHFLVR